VDVFTDIREVRRRLHRWRAGGETIAIVPTMGNLHRGHVDLMRIARENADRVVATIFVNPTQFGPGEDYARYPRTIRPDVGKLLSAGVDALFAPGVREIYPRGVGESTVVSVPGISADLCGAFRPVHFAGVTSVVLRLFNIVTPDCAVFGEKDFQQLVIVRKMVSDLNLPIRIIGGKTVREPDGLALSSRNQYLTAGERARAPELYRALKAAAQALHARDAKQSVVERAAMHALRRSGFRPEYFAIREAKTLRVPEKPVGNLRILAAAWLGRARLIDNIPVRI
jgi:pantoate--beta-alanine ligase